MAPPATTADQSLPVACPSLGPQEASSSSPSPLSSPTNENAKGIDIKSAMSILSSRADAGGDRELREEHQKTVPTKVSEERRGMGQSIDLKDFQWTQMGKDGCLCPPTSSGAGEDAVTAAAKADPDAQAQRAVLEEQRKKNEADLRTKLGKMTISELLKAVLSAQSERTIGYKTYDRGLDTVLSTGNISAYPGVVAAATASFSVLSDTINAIRDVLLEKNGRKDLATLISTLQRHEKEKLSTTAALHLERIREQNEVAVANNGGDTRVHNMLMDGVENLRAKVQELVEAINETLEEIRYAVVEEAEEEE